jgi:hypothetical protein
MKAGDTDGKHVMSLCRPVLLHRDANPRQGRSPKSRNQERQGARSTYRRHHLMGCSTPTAANRWNPYRTAGFDPLETSGLASGNDRKGHEEPMPASPEEHL